MAKRGYGEGSIYFNENRKLWICEKSYIDPDTQERKRKKFAAKTQKEALAKGNKFIKSLTNGLSLAADKITVGEWIDRWLNDYVKIKVRPRTWEKYKSCMDCYIIPKYNKILLKDLKSPDLQRYFNSLLTSGRKDGGGLSSSTIRAARRYFSACLDCGVKTGVLAKNIIKLTEPPKLIKKEVITLSKEQMKLLLTQAKIINNDYMRMVLPSLLQLALNTGMRQGELFALKWEDINFSESCLYIRRSLACVIGKGFIFQDPKTKASKRRILLTPSDIEMLHKYWEWQINYKNDLGDKFSNNDLVFCGIFGQPLHAGNFISRYFKPLIKKCHISSNFTFHCLRHTHATILLQLGVNPKIVQERLGHSSIKTTLDTYSHVVPDIQNIAIEALDKLYK